MIKACELCGAIFDSRRRTSGCSPEHQAEISKIKRIKSSARHYTDNKEKILLRCAAYRKSNKSRVRAWLSDWQKANPEKVAAYSKRWREENPETGREIHRKARARKNMARLLLQAGNI